MRTTHTRAHRRSTALIGLLTLLLSTLIGAATAAAAPPYETDATITSVDFTQEEVVSGSSTQLTVTWELPDHSPAPAGFVVDLPPDLQGRTDAFPLLDGTGEPMGQCTVTTTQIYCDLDADYLAANPMDVHGDLSFWVTVRTEVTETTEVTYDIDGVEGTIIVNPPPSGTCETDCEFTGRGSYKWGTYDTESHTISWRVVVKAPTEGMAGGQQLTVVDRVGPMQEIVSVRVRQTNELVTNGQGRETPGNYVVLDPSRYTVSADLSTVTMTTEQGYFYVVDYVTAVTDGGASSTYTNEADLTIAGETTTTGRAEVVYQGGSGSGSGTNVGSFTITKEVIGAIAAAGGITFSGTYVVTTPADEVHEGTFEVTAGQTWTSGEFPRGSTVHLTEVLPTAPENLTWAAPVFSENDFTLGSGRVTAVTLTNEATLLTGAFSVAKSIEGDGAALVPSDATFEVGYSYPAGPGYEAGSGELVVPADGTAVESPQLPAGAVLTLTETTPDAISGLRWEAAVFSADSVTIAAGEVTAVDLTNTASAVPPPSTTDEPIEPRDVPVPQHPALPETGADLSSGALVGALALILAGAATLALRRRQRV